ncbi:cardiolipin synthase [Tersicoccus solisilvae]|uniref:cardiolipin synthase n=1 Tax=Tersicoccus solisilvae TaxID=1882339 RepID=UPI001E474A9E
MSIVNLSALPLGWAIAVAATEFVIRLVVLGIVPHKRRPSVALGWLLAIYLIPFVGLILFLLLGSHRLPRARREKQVEMNRLIRENSPPDAVIGDDRPLPIWVRSTAVMNDRLGALPMTAGNDLTLLDGYDTAYTAMVEAVRAARRYVHVEFYIAAEDPATAPLLDALDDAVARGVTVRFLLDHLGSAGYPGYPELVRRLDASGVQWARMLPFRPWKLEYTRPDLRNHRKIVVIDGDVAFTGSQNCIDRSYNKRRNRRRGLRWEDLWVHATGPVVDALNALFVTDWYSETDELLVHEAQDELPAEASGGLMCQVVPSGPGFENENNLRMINTVLYHAQERVDIVSPYFVPDESSLSAVTSAAQRGVRINLYVSEISDQFFVYHAQRSYYEELMEAGVTIYLYRSPTILHTKAILIDQEVAVVGSSNMDMRSFALNLEVSTLVHGGAFVTDLDRVVARYRANSAVLELDQWRQRPLGVKFLDNVCRLTSALM